MKPLDDFMVSSFQITAKGLDNKQIAFVMWELDPVSNERVITQTNNALWYLTKTVKDNLENTTVGSKLSIEDLLNLTNRSTSCTAFQMSLSKDENVSTCLHIFVNDVDLNNDRLETITTTINEYTCFIDHKGAVKGLTLLIPLQTDNLYNSQELFELEKNVRKLDKDLLYITNFLFSGENNLITKLAIMDTQIKHFENRFNEFIDDLGEIKSVVKEINANQNKSFIVMLSNFSVKQWISGLVILFLFSEVFSTTLYPALVKPILRRLNIVPSIEMLKKD